MNAVRRCTSDDLAWMSGLFKRRMPNNYDRITAEAWVGEIVLKAPLTFYAARTDDAFLIALLTCEPWLPNELHCYVVVAIADHGKAWQTLPLLRASIKWARERRAVLWRYHSDTGHDIGPLMRRIGAHTTTPRYQIDLGTTAAAMRLPRTQASRR